jgi:hypothetical protein
MEQRVDRAYEQLFLAGVEVDATLPGESDAVGWVQLMARAQRNPWRWTARLLGDDMPDAVRPPMVAFRRETHRRVAVRTAHFLGLPIGVTRALAEGITHLEASAHQAPDTAVAQTAIYIPHTVRQLAWAARVASRRPSAHVAAPAGELQDATRPLNGKGLAHP